MSKYTADFETCTWLENETYVWAWAVCNIETEEINLGNNIKSFIEYCENELTLTDGDDLHLLDSFKLWAEQIFG